MSESAAKKHLQQLQRAIVDGLEDVKAHDIRVFDTAHLSPLFERVIVASGTSNRQTKALAANVRDKVRESGFAKPRVEGEDNGEWIIVDCGAAVAHIMQPAIRQYYNLEEIWGEKQVRLKSVSAAAARSADKAAAKKAALAATAGDQPPARAPAKKAPAAAKKAPPVKTAAKKTPAKKAVKAVPAKTAVKAALAKTAAKKTVAKKAVAKKTAVRKT